MEEGAAAGGPSGREPHGQHVPTSQLPHVQKLARQRRHVEMLTGALLLVLLLLVYSAAFDLNHWAEWIVFGAIIAVAIGVMIAVRPGRADTAG